MRQKGNVEGAPAWHKAGRCGQKVNCPRGAREAALGRRPLRNRPVTTYHGVGATLVVAPRAAIKAAPTEPRMHRPIGAREVALGRQPLRKMPGIEKGRLNCQPSFFSYFFKRSSIASSRSRDFGTRVFLESAFNGSTNLLSREDINFLRFTKTDSAI